MNSSGGSKFFKRTNSNTNVPMVISILADIAAASLLKRGANVNAQEKGTSPLVAASANGHEDLVSNSCSRFFHAPILNK